MSVQAEEEYSELDEYNEPDEYYEEEQEYVSPNAAAMNVGQIS